MKAPNTLFVMTLAISSMAIGLSAQADTVKARCDVYHKGEDRVAFTVPCAFSQRQGFVSIRLPDGTRYDLTPVGNEPNKYTDQNGQPAYRESGLGDRGEIFRLAERSIFVYWQN